MTKKKLSFIEFINKLEDYELIEKFSERVSVLCGVHVENLTSLSYRQLKETVPQMILEQKFEEAMWLIVRNQKKDVKFKHVKRVDNYTKLKFFFFIKDQYAMIRRLEEQYLVSPPSPKMIGAGIKELDVLGDVNLIDALAGGDVLKWEAVKDLPYSTIFDKQLKMTIEGRIARKLKENQKHGHS